MTGLPLLRTLALTVLGAALAFVLAAGLMAPYEARALLHTGAGQDSGDRERVVDTVLAQLRAPGLIESALGESGMAVLTVPDYLPLLGYAVARASSGDEPVAPLAGRRRNAFGGERIKLNVFEFSQAQRHGRLLLIAGEDQSYTLLDETGGLLLASEAGQRAHAPSIALRLRVAELRARPGTWIWLHPAEHEDLASDLRKRVRVGARDESGRLLEIALTGDSIGLLEGQLDAIMNALLEMASGKQRKQASAAARGAAGMLAAAERDMDAARLALEAWQQGGDRVSLTDDDLAALNELVARAGAVAEAEVRREVGSALLEDASYTAAPGADPAQSLAALPADQRRLADLMIERETRLRRYLALLAVIADLEKLATTSGHGGPRLIESTRVRPAGLGTALWLGLAGGVTGMLGGLALAWRASGRRQGLNEAVHVEIAARAPLLGIVAHDVDMHWPAASRPRAGPDDVGLESFRSLCIAVDLLASEKGTRVVSVAGVAPASGGRAVAALLASAATARGQRTLWLDCAGDDDTGPQGVPVPGAPATQPDPALVEQLPDLTSDTNGLAIAQWRAAEGSDLANILSAASPLYDLVVVSGPVPEAVDQVSLWVARKGVDTRNALRRRVAGAVPEADGVVLTGVRLDLSAYVPK